MASNIVGHADKQERCCDIYPVRDGESFQPNTYWLSLNFFSFCKMAALVHRRILELACKMGPDYVETELENYRFMLENLTNIKAQWDANPRVKPEHPGTKSLTRLRMTFMDKPGKNGEVGFAYFDKSGTKSIREFLGEKLAQMEAAWKAAVSGRSQAAPGPVIVAPVQTQRAVVQQAPIQNAPVSGAPVFSPDEEDGDFSTPVAQVSQTVKVVETPKSELQQFMEMMAKQNATIAALAEKMEKLSAEK